MTNTESTKQNKLHEQHIEDNLECDIEDKLTEIDISFFPSNIFYKLLGVEFILEKHKLNPDPIMMPLYEKLAEDILDPQEAFNLKQFETELDARK